MASAFITGITGQDGYYLANLLLQKGYDVHGVVRRTSATCRTRIDLLQNERPESGAKLHLHYGDVTDSAGIIRLILKCRPAEVYNLAAQSHVRISFDKPGYTQSVNAGGAFNVLEAVRMLAEEQEVRFYQASTSEMFGGLPGTDPQSESTAFHPRSPYATSKTTAFHHTVNYREAYGLFACNGILFNHESPLRGENFVTRKITRAVARIKVGLQDTLKLGNLDAQRDWGFAGDYVQAMWLMVQHHCPEDFVIATGHTHTVREFLELAFDAVGLNWQEFTTVEKSLFRPADVDLLRGDSTKAREKLGWEPTVTFHDLVNMMVEADCELARNEAGRNA